MSSEFKVESYKGGPEVTFYVHEDGLSFEVEYQTSIGDGRAYETQWVSVDLGNEDTEKLAEELRANWFGHAE